LSGEVPVFRGFGFFGGTGQSARRPTSRRATISGWCPLGSQRLALRRLTAADVDLLVALDSDPEVLRYLSRSAPSRSEVSALVAALVSDYSSHPRWGRWPPFDRADGGFAGWLALSVLGPGELDLGYRLRP